MHIVHCSQSKLARPEYAIYRLHALITSHHTIYTPTAAFLILNVNFQASSSAPSLPSFSSFTSTSSLSSASALAFPLPELLFFFLVGLDGVASSSSSSLPSSAARIVSQSSGLETSESNEPVLRLRALPFLLDSGAARPTAFTFFRTLPRLVVALPAVEKLARVANSAMST